MLLYIIRHGDPDYATDSLTPRGLLQAEAVGKRLVDAKIDRIFSSPMGRALQTAAPACRLLGLPCEIEPWTHELTHEQLTAHSDNMGRGARTGSIYVQSSYFMEQGNYDFSYSHTFDNPVFEGTQMKAARDYLEENGKAFLERLGYREENGIYRILQPNEEKVALFCHGAFSRTWLSILLRITLHVMIASFGSSHTGVTILKFTNNENGFTVPRCLCYCDVGHLYANGLEINYPGNIAF